MTIHAEPRGERILVLDGDMLPELARRGVVVRPSPGAFPLAVRESLAMRRVLRDAALAGADVVTAPTGELHRRALARNGASRRAREWIATAVAVARDAIDEADDAGRSSRGAQPAPPLRLAALVLPLEGAHRPDFAPDASTAGAEHRAHAGMLADAGAEIVRIERMGTISESEAATRAAVDTGLAAWSGVAVASDGRTLVSGEPLEAWADVVTVLGPAAFLVSAPTVASAEGALRLLAARTRIPVGAAVPASAPPARDSASPSPDGEAAAGTGGENGGHGREAVPSEPGQARPVEDQEREDGAGTRRGGAELPDPSATRLIAAGARMLWPDGDASPARVRSVRAAVDQVREAEAAALREAIERRTGWAAQAASRAARGPALWLGERPPAGSLPEGFTWDVAPETDLPLLPAERYVLAIAPSGKLDPSRGRWAVSAVRPGGWLLVEGARDALSADSRLEGLEPAASLEPGGEAWIARRRP